MKIDRRKEFNLNNQQKLNSTRKQNKPDDEETVLMHRERNLLAAQRCRHRRRDMIEKLEKICSKLENYGSKIVMEISDMEKEILDLRSILANHMCKRQDNIHQSQHQSLVNHLSTDYHDSQQQPPIVPYFPSNPRATNKGQAASQFTRRNGFETYPST